MALRDILDSQFFRPRNLVPAGFAAVFAVVSWFGIQDFLFESDPPPEPAAAPAPAPMQSAEEAPPAVVEPPPVYPKVLVARRDIGSGVMLVSGLLEWREWREPIDFNTAVLQDTVPLKAILGSVTRQPYSEGTPVAWNGIITPGGPGFIGAVLEPGMRAVTVEVDRATTSANIIFPGDRVDLILVVAARDGGAESAAQAIVRDARVLAVGSTIVSLGRYGKVNLTKAGAIEPVAPPAGDNYTLEVSPVDAERISLAVVTGSLTLAMRSVANVPERGWAPEHPVRFSEVMRQPPPAVAPPPVRIIRGGKEETVAVDS